MVVHNHLLSSGVPFQSYVMLLKGIYNISVLHLKLNKIDVSPLCHKDDKIRPSNTTKMSYSG